MTSPRRRQDRPIRSVTLRVAFRADKVTAAKIKKAFPAAVFRGEVCEVKIEAEEPSEVAGRAKELLEKIRTAV